MKPSLESGLNLNPVITEPLPGVCPFHMDAHIETRGIFLSLLTKSCRNSETEVSSIRSYLSYTIVYAVFRRDR